MKKGEIVFSAVCVAFFGFMLTQTFELMGQGRAGEVGSGFWPLISLAAATALSAVWLVRNLAAYARQKPRAASEPSPEAISEARGRQRKVALSVACLLAYIVLMPLVGFILSTIFFILAFILALEERRMKVLVISPVLITAAIIVVFAKFITIPLPKGVSFFAAFSRFFY
jgi:putative tricarboxylic transport membrane protein